MALLETATGPLAYDDRGEGDPIVLLSSGAHDRHDFDELRELLPARFRSIAPDWPAHGESPPGSAPASAMRFADVAEELVETARPGRRRRRRQLGRRLRRRAPGDPPPRPGQGPGAGRQRRLRRTAAAGAGLLRADVAARLPAPRLSPLRRSLHAPAERRRPACSRRRNRDHARGPGPEGGRRALAQLRLPRARPAAGRALDLVTHAGCLGQARPGDPAEAGAPGGRIDPRARSSSYSTPATRRRSAIPRASPRT